MYGYLRETTEAANKAGIDKETGINRTGLDEYLKVIFHTTTDWLHDKSFGGSDKAISRHRPDYRSESLKLIVEFDGIQHYQSPIQIKRDKETTELYEKYGYKVVRIPWFIQLTNKVVKTLFNVDCDIQLFPDGIPSFNKLATPAFMCLLGIKRAKEEFMSISQEQYDVNVRYLESLNDEDLSGVNLLKEL